MGRISHVGSHDSRPAASATAAVHHEAAPISAVSSGTEG
jgi:hypothetical protein